MNNFIKTTQQYLPLATLSVALLISSGNTFGTILYQDDFTYTDGDLVGQGGWGNHSGSGSLIQVSGETISTVQGGGSREDASHSLGATIGAGDSWYARFDVTVGGTADASTTYFSHFKDAGTGFNSRVFVTAPNTATNNFTFAIGETSSSTPAAAFVSDFAYGTIYRILFGYNYDTGISQLWIDPLSMASLSINSTTQADPGEDLSLIAFRQSGGNTTQMIDNLVVATTFDEALTGVSSTVPAPATLALFGLGLAGLGWSRRKKA